MPLIEQAVAETSEALQELTIAADRDTLTRRRWRGSALDGTDFAFALTDPVRHGSVIFEGQGKRYRVRQMPEPVLVVPLPDEPLMAARTAWFFGNMHLPIELRPGEVIIAEEPTLRERITAAGMTWTAREDVFQPSKHCDTPAHSHFEKPAPHQHANGDGWHTHGDGRWHKH
jgi:urease accessory protein